MTSDAHSGDIHLCCHRCGATLTPGKGDFYVVRIEAFADPTPPTLEKADLDADVGAEIDSLLKQMENMSEADLMDQVYRRLVVHLCRRCYRAWIEDPTG